MINGELIATGGEHHVYRLDGIITKKPRRSRKANPEKVRHDIEYIAGRFHNFAIQSSFERGSNGDYTITQPFTDGEHLTIQNIGSVLDQVLALLDLNNTSIKENGIGLDLWGREGYLRYILYKLSSLKDGNIDKLIILPVLKFLSKKGNFFDNLNTLWELGGNIELANIIQTCDKSIKIIDTGLLNEKSNNLIERTKAKVLNTFSNYMVKKYLLPHITKI